MITLKNFKSNSNFMCELFMENLESLVFTSDQMVINKLKYHGKNEMCEVADDDGLITEEKIYNIYFDDIDIVISAKAKKISPVIFLGHENSEKYENFDRLLNGKDITDLYFYYPDDTGFYGSTPYDSKATFRMNSNCKYYLDDFGNLHIELTSKGAKKYVR